MNRICKQTAAVLLAFWLVFQAAAAADAAEAVDMTKKGSISVEMEYDSMPVEGGSLTLYYVADIEPEADHYSFHAAGEFAGSGIDLSDITSRKLAEELEEYAEAQQLSGDKRPVDSDGKVTFDDLRPALYLIIQEEAPDDYYMATPILVTVPIFEENVYNYHVNATPKVELVKGSVLPTGRPYETDEPQTTDEPQPSEKPQSSGEPQPSGTTTASPKPQMTESPQPSATKTPIGFAGGSSGQGSGSAKLPQTGQLNWPIPFMAISGMLLFAFGWWLQFSRNKENAQSVQS